MAAPPLFGTTASVGLLEVGLTSAPDCQLATSVSNFAAICQSSAGHHQFDCLLPPPPTSAFLPHPQQHFHQHGVEGGGIGQQLGLFGPPGTGFGFAGGGLLVDDLLAADPLGGLQHFGHSGPAHHHFFFQQNHQPSSTDLLLLGSGPNLMCADPLDQQQQQLQHEQHFLLQQMPMLPASTLSTSPSSFLPVPHPSHPTAASSPADEQPAPPTTTGRPNGTAQNGRRQQPLGSRRQTRMRRKEKSNGRHRLQVEKYHLADTATTDGPTRPAIQQVAGTLMETEEEGGMALAGPQVIRLVSSSATGSSDALAAMPMPLRNQDPSCPGNPANNIPLLELSPTNEGGGGITAGPTTPPACAHCGQQILDPMMLATGRKSPAATASMTTTNPVPAALGKEEQHGQKQFFHFQCLKCSECEQSLELAPKCFVRNGTVFCGQCYAKRFIVFCAMCEKQIEPGVWIRRARNWIYHLVCFKCEHCQRQLGTGEQFSLDDSAQRQSQVLEQQSIPRLLCKQHYMELVRGEQCSPKPKAKRVRTTFGEEQLAILQEHFKVDSNPDGADLERIALLTGLTKRVTQVWFQNSRARQKKYSGSGVSRKLAAANGGVCSSSSNSNSSTGIGPGGADGGCCRSCTVTPASSSGCPGPPSPGFGFDSDNNSSGQGARRKLLFVDDSPPNSQMDNG